MTGAWKDLVVRPVTNSYAHRFIERVPIDMRAKPLIVIMASITLVSGGLLAQWWHRTRTRCAERNARLQAQVRYLEDDAHNALRLGVKKPGVAQFFQEHGMKVSFGYGSALGSINVTGCSPFGCGRDDATIGVSVNVDPEGTVVGEPHVSGIYTDCL